MNIEGYSYGKKEVPKSPVTLEELERLKQSASLTEEDLRHLKTAGDILEGQTDAVIDTWRGIIGSLPHLAFYFVGPDEKPDNEYKAKVKERFKQWVLDVCRRPLDQSWLDYQHEIGLRHTHQKKNRTDDAATPPHIPLRYILAFTAVVNDTIKPFLSRKGHSADAVEGMHRAWCKMVLLHVTLWSRAYVVETDW